MMQAEIEGKIHIQETINEKDPSKANCVCGIVIAGSQTIIKQWRHSVPDVKRCKKCYSQVGDSYQ